MNVSLRYAVEHKLIPVNLAEGIDLPKRTEGKAYHTRNIDTQKNSDYGADTDPVGGKQGNAYPYADII